MPELDPNQPAAVAWTEGLDAELIGHAQNLQLHDKPAAEAARQLAKAHRESQVLLGVPKDRLVQLPDANAAPEAWKPVWERLGAPADPKDYDFSSVKNGDQPLAAEETEFVRGLAAELNLPKDKAVLLAQRLTKAAFDADASEAAELTAAQGVEAQKLKENWGPNAEANLFVAKQTALKLGVKPEQVDALEKTIGYAGVMEMFRSIGARIGEDRFVNSGDSGKIMTREQATARKAELMADTEWTKRYLNGGAGEKREMEALARIITAD